MLISWWLTGFLNHQQYFQPIGPFDGHRFVFERRERRPSNASFVEERGSEGTEPRVFTMFYKPSGNGEVRNGWLKSPHF